MTRVPRTRGFAFGVAAIAFLVALGVTLTGQSRALLDAVKEGDSRAAKAQLAQKAEPNVADADGTTALHWAVENDDAELAQALIGAGARAQVANRHGVTPLHLASTNGNATIVQRLIAAAVVNREFRERLLCEPEWALSNGYMGQSFSLTDQERTIVVTVRARDLTEFAQKVNQALKNT